MQFAPRRPLRGTLSNWLKALKDDKREIFRAAADAQRIADMVLGFHPNFSADITANPTQPDPVRPQCKDSAPLAVPAPGMPA